MEEASEKAEKAIIKTLNEYNQEKEDKLKFHEKFDYSTVVMEDGQIAAEAILPDVVNSKKKHKCKMIIGEYTKMVRNKKFTCIDLLVDLLERIKMTHDILNELRGKPLPALQKLDKEIVEAIADLRATSSERVPYWEEAIKQRNQQLSAKEK